MASVDEIQTVGVIGAGRNLVAAGWLVRKSGWGFYMYDEKGDRAGSAV